MGGWGPRCGNGPRKWARSHFYAARSPTFPPLTLSPLTSSLIVLICKSAHLHIFGCHSSMHIFTSSQLRFCRYAVMPPLPIVPLPQGRGERVFAYLSGARGRLSSIRSRHASRSGLDVAQLRCFWAASEWPRDGRLESELPFPGAPPKAAGPATPGPERLGFGFRFYRFLPSGSATALVVWARIKLTV